MLNWLLGLAKSVMIFVIGFTKDVIIGTACNVIING